MVNRQNRRRVRADAEKSGVHNGHQPRVADDQIKPQRKNRGIQLRGGIAYGHRIEMVGLQ